MPLLKHDQIYASNGLKKTKSLFPGHGSEEEPILSLYSDQGDGLLSLKDLFLLYVLDDPTEFTFAYEVFGELAFWEHLKSIAWVKTHYEEWKREVDAARKSQAFKVLYTEVVTEGKGKLGAAKYLIEEPWISGNGVDGRKARQKVRESTKEAYEATGLRNDVKRLKEDGLLN